MFDSATSAEARTTPDDPSGRRGSLLVVATIAFALFIALGAFLSTQPRTTFDTAVRAWVVARNNSAGVSLATFVSTVGSVTPMIVYAFIILSLVSFRRRSMVPLTAILAPAAAVIGYLGTKSIFLRTRPSGVGNAFEGTYSFPSAHATTSSAVCCTLGYLLFRERVLSRSVAAAAAIALSLVIGMSRIYLDVHWATDILGGWCLGVAIACTTAAIYESAGGPEARGRVTREIK